MKRFLLFIGETYHPLGGAQDFVDDFATRVEAQTHAEHHMPFDDWANILDTQTRDIWTHHRSTLGWFGPADSTGSVVRTLNKGGE